MSPPGWLPTPRGDPCAPPPHYPGQQGELGPPARCSVPSLCLHVTPSLSILFITVSWSLLTPAGSDNISRAWRFCLVTQSGQQGSSCLGVASGTSLPAVDSQPLCANPPSSCLPGSPGAWRLAALTCHSSKTRLGAPLLGHQSEGEAVASGQPGPGHFRSGQGKQPGGLVPRAWPRLWAEDFPASTAPALS